MHIPLARVTRVRRSRSRHQRQQHTRHKVQSLQNARAEYYPVTRLRLRRPCMCLSQIILVCVLIVYGATSSVLTISLGGDGGDETGSSTDTDSS